MSGLKVDTYTRPPKQVIRITEGGNHRDGPEVSIEISGSLAPSAIERQRAWARKIAAVEDLISSMWAAVAVIDEFPWRPGDRDEVCRIGRDLERALALLDPPTTTVDGAATGAGPENQEDTR